MAKEYNLGKLIGIMALTATVLFIVYNLFGETIYGWLKSAVASKTLLGLLGISIVAAFSTFIRELNNWRVTFSPRLKIWRMSKGG